MIEGKVLWKYIPVPVIPSILFFYTGNTLWAFISLCLIPLFGICSGFYITRFSEEWKRIRVIGNHLTETEQQQFKSLSAKYAAKCGVLDGVGFFGPLGILIGFHLVENFTYIVLYALTFLAIEIPLTSHWRRSMIDFALTTEYAKEKGWDTL